MGGWHVAVLNISYESWGHAAYLSMLKELRKIKLSQNEDLHNIGRIATIKFQFDFPRNTLHFASSVLTFTHGVGIRSLCIMWASGDCYECSTREIITLFRELRSVVKV